MTQQTIPEMAREYRSSLPRPEDDVLSEIRTYQLRCSHCGSDTSPIDPCWPNELRICLRCLIEIAEDPGYDQDAYDTLKEENDELQDRASSLANEIAELESTNARTIEHHDAEMTTLLDKIRATEELNRAMHETVDALQEQIDGWDDDVQSLRNKISVLERDVEKWRTLSMRKGKAHS